MSGEEILSVAVRWIHIWGAIGLAGGTVFMRLALHPVLTSLPSDQQSDLREKISGRWRLWAHVLLAMILFSGLYNFYDRFAEVKPMPYHAFFGLKFLLAMVVFFFASALVGRSSGLAAIRQNAGFYLNLNVVLAMILVLLGGLMRVAPLKADEAAQAQSPSALVRPVATSNSANSGTSIALSANP